MTTISPLTRSPTTKTALRRRWVNLPSRERASRFFKASTLAGKPVPVRPFHVPGFIPGRTVTLLNADGGMGKSLIALQLCCATALGRKWLNREVEPGRALFISAEDDQDELHRRLADIAQAEGIDLRELDALTLRSLAGEDALLALEVKGGALKATSLFNEIEKHVTEIEPRIVVLDTLADLFPRERKRPCAGAAIHRPVARPRDPV